MADLTITFLGTGTSQGIPMVGCDCAVCLSPDPRDTRSRASILVEAPEAAWVVDTGPDFRQQCLREKIQWIDAAVYTHSHTDHIMGFDDLRPFCYHGNTFPIHASEETMADLRRVFAFAFSGDVQFPGYVRPDPQIITGPFLIGETSITPLRVEHGRTHVFGYLFERNGERLAAYLSDCKAVAEGVVERIAGVRHLIVDALRYRPHPTHMNVDEALTLKEAVRPGVTWFTHICHDLGHAEAELRLPPNVYLAYDGLKLKIDATAHPSLPE